MARVKRVSINKYIVALDEVKELKRKNEFLKIRHERCVSSENAKLLSKISKLEKKLEAKESDT